MVCTIDDRCVFHFVFIDDEDEVDLADLCRCSYCLRSLKSPFELQQHMIAVHSINSRRLRINYRHDSTTCFICEMHFDNRALFESHMNHVHVNADAPYQCRKCQFRSSLRIDIIQHFQQVCINTSPIYLF